MNDLLKAEDLCKTFGPIEAVRRANIQIAPGEFVAVMGRSGSGKTTLLHLLAGLERPDAGRVLFNGQDVSSLDEDKLALWRRDHIGLVFQAFFLIPTLSALENVAFPLYPSKMPAAERRRRAEERLAQVGLIQRADHRPTRLSGGEQQRVAIARAIITHPGLILADEPTGNLDSTTEAEIMALFQRLRQETGAALFIITHDEKVASGADRILYMQDGVLSDEKKITS